MPDASRGEGPAEPEEDGFHDYTVATALEKLVASIETALRHVLTKDLPRRLEVASGAASGARLPHTYSTKVHHRLPFRSETYTLAVHLPGAGASTLGDCPHKLQEWFLPGVPCLTLGPNSYSGRVLEAEEARTLASAGAAALAHLRLSWPLLVPVHDALRDAARGMALVPPPGAALVRLESDSLHGRSLPGGLCTLGGQLAAFVERLRWHAPAAAALCAELAAARDPHGGGADQSLASAAAAVSLADASWTAVLKGTNAGLSVRWAARRCYALPDRLGGGGDAGGGRLARAPSSNLESSVEQSSVSQYSGNDDLELVIDTWDEEAPWRPWAAEDDPVGALEVDATWRARLFPPPAGAVPDSPDPDAPPPPPRSAAGWRLAAAARGYRPDDGRRPLFLLQPVDQRRRFLRLQSIVEVADEGIAGLHPPAEALPGDASFAGMLSVAAEAAGVAAVAADASELASDEWWLGQGNYVPPAPPPCVLQDAVRDLFRAAALPPWPGAGLLGDQLLAFEGTEEAETSSDVGGQRGSEQTAGKAAPLGALATRLALHALRLGNPRAVAALWARFLRELRFAHWEPAAPLPRMGGHDGGGAPDPSCCLLHQKLQMVDLCIREIRRRQGQPRPASSGSEDAGRYRSAEGSDAEDGGAKGDGAPKPALARADGSAALSDDSWGWDAWGEEVSTALQGSGRSGELSVAAAAAAATEPQGVASQLGIALLDFPDRRINVPVTQEPPPVTEDALAEEAAAAEAAAPPLSETAWARTGHGALLFSDMQAFKAANPGCIIADFIRWHSPKDWEASPGGGGRGAGGALSARMADPQGRWQRLWDAAAAVPASSQRPLFQPALEGERALHFLETLPPAALLAELLALGFAAALELLGRAPAAQLPSVAAQLARARELGADWLGPAGVAALDPAAAAAAADGGSDGEEAPSVYEDDESEDSEAAFGRPRWPVGAAAAAAAGPAIAALLHSGLSMPRMKALIEALGCAEQTVAAGQSILQRLGPPGAAPAAAALAQAAAAGLVAAALRHGSGAQGAASGLEDGVGQGAPEPYGTVSDLSAEEFEVLEAAAGSGGDGDDGEARSPWRPRPFWSEWSLEVGAEEEEAAAPGRPLHRLFVRRLPAELRIATTITSEMT